MWLTIRQYCSCTIPFIHLKKSFILFIFAKCGQSCTFETRRACINLYHLKIKLYFIKFEKIRSLASLFFVLLTTISIGLASFFTMTQISSTDVYMFFFSNRNGIIDGIRLSVSMSVNLYVCPLGRSIIYHISLFKEYV